LRRLFGSTCVFPACLKSLASLGRQENH